MTWFFPLYFAVYKDLSASIINSSILEPFLYLLTPIETVYDKSIFLCNNGIQRVSILKIKGK